jgi:hypothetical protein
MVYKFGPTVKSTRVSLQMTPLTERVRILLQKEMSIRAISFMARPMAWESWRRLLATFSKASGRTTSSMDRETRCGLMELATRGIMSMGLRKEEEVSVGQMTTLTPARSWTTKYMARALSPGLMAGSM